MDFNTTQVYFGCEGNESRPRIVEYYNRMVIKGSRRRVVPPSDRYEDYTDKYGYYHVVEREQWSKDDHKTMGFVMETKDAGTFKTKLTLYGDSIACDLIELLVHVEEEPKTLMYCKDDKHASMDCHAGIRPKV